jgi:hypothetical protein
MGSASVTVVATVGPTALTGVACVEQNGAWSNAGSFAVPSGNPVALLPNLLNMVVGDTHTVQAVNSTGQPVTGLTWTSSDPTVVSLSTDNPPLLTAVAAGHVTVTAGSASIDVTVSAADLPLGTVTWSNPGNGSGVYKIVPAVPSATGVADVFAFQNDGTVQAITSDGTTAWTAQVGCPGSPVSLPAVADFQGGLVAMQGDCNTGSPTSIVKFDGLTGQAYPVYTPSSPWVLESNVANNLVAHPDGTVFAVLANADGQTEPPPHMVVGIDPTTGAQKFSVPATETESQFGLTMMFSPIIAGDGYAYVPYANWFGAGSPGDPIDFRVLRVSTSGAFNDIVVLDWVDAPSEVPGMQVAAITNADTGIVLSWRALGSPYMAVTNGTNVSVVSAPTVGNPNVGLVMPTLQAQDGSFVGTALDNSTNPATPNMVAFDASGNVRWSVPGYTPQIASADGGVIATDPNTGSAITFDQNGNVTGRLGNLPTQSWTLNEYQVGSTDQVVAAFINFGVSFAPFQRGSTSPGTPQNVPVDSKANETVKNILTRSRWRQFSKSTCASVFANAQGIPSMIPNYSLAGVQKKQQMTNFYDLGNSGVSGLTLRQVTGGQIPNNVSLADYLTNASATAATANMGYDRQTAVVFQAGFFSQQSPEFTVVHELLLQAYAAQPDNAIFGNAYFQQQGLWRPLDSTATVNISTWMSTDCTCTPGNPSAPACQANTAKW